MPFFDYCFLIRKQLERYASRFWECVFLFLKQPLEVGKFVLGDAVGAHGALDLEHIVRKRFDEIVLFEDRSAEGFKIAAVTLQHDGARNVPGDEKRLQAVGDGVGGRSAVGIGNGRVAQKFVLFTQIDVGVHRGIYLLYKIGKKNAVQSKGENSGL